MIESTRVLSAVMSEVRSFTADERPANNAITQTEKILESLPNVLPEIPDPIAVIPIDGGIQIAWKSSDRHVHLFCERDPGRSYIYKGQTSAGTTTGTLMVCDLLGLIEAIKWIQQNV